MPLLKIYKKNGVWMFDDFSKSVLEEPFICGSSEIIDCILKEKGIFNGSHRGVEMYFSDQRESQDIVELKKIEDLPDNWAKYEYKGIEGLLCPVTIEYLGRHPESIFVRFTKPPFELEFQLLE
jgi:hypothetical protein